MIRWVSKVNDGTCLKLTMKADPYPCFEYEVGYGSRFVQLVPI